MQTVAEPQSFFVNPRPPTTVRKYVHDHVWTEIGATLNPNETWSSLWSCSLCPDIGIGGQVGPVPKGYCGWCGWVNREWEKKRCAECGHLLDDLDPDDDPRP